MTTYHQEKVRTAIAKIAECVGQNSEAWGHLQDIGKWSAETEREAYARGKADVLAQLKPVAIMLPSGDVAPNTASAADMRACGCQPLAIIPEN